MFARSITFPVVVTSLLPILFYVKVTAECPKDWTVIKDKICLYFLDKQQTWQDSLDACKKLMPQSSLISCLDNDELVAFRTIGPKVLGQQNVWVGLFYDTKLAAWKWSDGLPFNEKDFGSSSPWMDSQPDNIGDENCGNIFVPLGKLMNFKCEGTLSAICKVYQWTEWTAWTECSQTCGKGQRTRNRSCPQKDRCPGDQKATTLTEDCTVKQCPLWTAWSAWSACTKSCGGGERKRSRTCQDGPGCQGSGEEKEACNTGKCAAWSDWSLWKACSKSCAGGTQTRSRECLGGSSCIGDSIENRDCNKQPCVEAPCPAGYKTRIANSCYKLINRTVWNKADALCKEDDAVLVGNISANKLCLLTRAITQRQLARSNDGYWTMDESPNSQGNDLKRALVIENNILLAQAGNKNSEKTALCEIAINSVCFTGWTPSQGQCYKIFKQKLSFDEADKTCISHGGQLASVHVDDQVALLNNLLTVAGLGIAWFGFNDKASVRSFEFTDKSDVSDFMSLKDVNPRNLESGRSNTERCFVAALSGNTIGFEAHDCALKFAYVCRVHPPVKNLDDCFRPKLNAPQTPTFKTDYPECPKGWNFVKGEQSCSCWNATAQTALLDDAETYCGQLKTNLITILDAKEQATLKDLLSKQKLTSAWLGYTDRQTEKIFVPLDGSEATYKNINGKPTNNPNPLPDQHCVSVLGNGNWQTDWCYNSRPIICDIDVSCTPPTTPKPYPTLGAVERIVATVVQTMGSVFIIGILGCTFGAFLVLRNFSIERTIMMSEEITLLWCFVIVTTARDNYGDTMACKTVAIVLHYFYLVHFAFLLLEAIQTYCIVTCVILSGGFFNRWQNLVIGWGGSLAIVLVTAAFHHDHYITPVMCILDVSGQAATAVMLPIIVVIVLAIIYVEATGMAEEVYPKIPGYDATQMTTCKVSQTGLLIIIPLSAASWLLTTIAISQANIGLYTVCFGINMSLATAILVFHALANPQVRYIFIQMYKFLKRILCPAKKIDDGSFDADFKLHTYNLW